MDPMLQQVEKLREWRARPDRSKAIGDDVVRLQRHVERSGRRLADFITLWEEMLPGRLTSRTRVQAIRGGVAHVIVESSPTLYQVDRLLRSGLEAELRSRFTATLVRVRLALGPLEDPGMEGKG